MKYARYKYVPSVIRYVLVKNMIKSSVAKYRQHELEDDDAEDDDENESSTNRHVGAAEFAQNARDFATLMKRYGGKWMSQTAHCCKGNRILLSSTLQISAPLSRVFNCNSV